MTKPADTFVILSPAFAAREGDAWLPAQEGLVRAINRNFPLLKVVILSFHFPLQQERRYHWYGNEVITFNGGLKGGLSSLLRWKSAWKELTALRKQRRVIGIFSFFCSECAFVGHYFARRYRIGHHIWVLGQDARRENNQVRRIRPAADELVCISDFLVDEFERNHGLRPAHMIPIGIDTTLFGSSAMPRTIDLLGAGSLIPLKQFDIFIEVIQKIALRLPDIQARICGDGPEREKLQAMIDASGLQRNVLLAGRAPHAGLLQTMQQSRILLHPSAYEGFGAVCLEALYAGAQVISFCRPMKAEIPHWHIVNTPGEMAVRALRILMDEQQDFTPVLPFEVNEVAIRIMTLFGYRPASTS
jgi:glycosyltransferase involved in cell wall biosynthesis